MTKKNIMKAIADANGKNKKNTIIAAGAAGATGFIAAAGAYLLGRLANNETIGKITDIEKTVNDITETLTEGTRSNIKFEGFTAIDIMEARRLKKSGTVIYAYDPSTGRLIQTEALYISNLHYVQVGPAAPAAPAPVVDEAAEAEKKTEDKADAEKK